MTTLNRFLLFNILFLVSCVNNQGIQSNSFLLGIYSYIGNSSNIKVDEDFFNEFDYSFAKFSFGDSRQAILVLESIDNDVYKWSGRNEVSVFTHNGRVIKTVGLEKNITLISYKDPGKSNFIIKNFYSPDLYNVSEKVLSNSSQLIEFNRFGLTYEALEVTEVKRIDPLRLNSKDKFIYIDEMIIYSEQKLHPQLPSIKIDFFYKF